MLRQWNIGDVTLLDLFFVLILLKGTESLKHFNGDRLVYVDETCLRSLSTSDSVYTIAARVCNYSSLQARVPVANSFGLQPAKFGVGVFRPGGNTAWTVHLVWNETIPCDRKLYFKIGFAARRFRIIKPDKICVELKFGKRDREVVNYHHQFKFDCLRVEPDNIGTVTVVDRPLARGCDSSREKHDISTECQCPEQSAHASIDIHGLVTVAFVRQPHVSGYRIEVKDKLTGQLIGDSERTQINATMDKVEYQTLGTGDGKGFIANVTFWCGSLTTELVMKRVCKDVVLNGRSPVLTLPRQSTSMATTKDFPTSWGIVIIVASFVAGTLSAIIVFVIHTRRGGSSGSSVGQNQGISCRTRYSAIRNNTESSPNGNNTLISNTLQNQLPESPSTSADNCEERLQSPNTDCPYIQIKRCAILFHPDRLTYKVAHIESKIELKGYSVCTHPCINLKKSQGAAENWLSVSEEIVQDYDDVIFVISPRFNLLWSTYASSDEEIKLQHQQLLSERKGRENIPCTVLSTMRTALFAMRQFKPRIHIVSLSCEDTQCHVLPFMTKAAFLQPIATVYCLGTESVVCKGGCYKILNTLPVLNKLALLNKFSHVIP